MYLQLLRTCRFFYKQTYFILQYFFLWCPCSILDTSSILLVAFQNELVPMCLRFCHKLNHHYFLAKLAVTFKREIKYAKYSIRRRKKSIKNLTTNNATRVKLYFILIDILNLYVPFLFCWNKFFFLNRRIQFIFNKLVLFLKVLIWILNIILLKQYFGKHIGIEWTFY